MSEAERYNIAVSQQQSDHPSVTSSNNPRLKWLQSRLLIAEELRFQC